jgi:hypothetical protein
MHAFSEEQVPTLAVIEAAVERVDASYRERANGLDTKAGVMLSAAGVIVALMGTTGSITAIISQALAIAAGSAAAWVIVPRIDTAVAPQDLRDRYLAVAPVRTRLVVLNSRIVLHAENEARLVAKHEGCARPPNCCSALLSSFWQAESSELPDDKEHTCDEERGCGR